MREVRKALPWEHIAYLGDTARLPYGNKSRETIIRFSLENARYLVNQGIKALVVACNTATAHALEVLEQALSIPVVGVIAPGVLSAVNSTKSGHIAVLGTRGTISSGAYQRAILSLMPRATIHPIACPLFVHLVEENFQDHHASRLIVQEYLRAITNTPVDTIILGCTHYPLLRHIIEEELDDRVTVVDASIACTYALQTVLREQRLLAPEQPHPKITYFVSDDPDSFKLISSRILFEGIEDIRVF